MLLEDLERRAAESGQPAERYEPDANAYQEGCHGAARKTSEITEGNMQKWEYMRIEVEQGYVWVVNGKYIGTSKMQQSREGCPLLFDFLKKSVLKDGRLFPLRTITQLKVELNVTSLSPSVRFHEDP